LPAPGTAAVEPAAAPLSPDLPAPAATPETPAAPADVAPAATPAAAGPAVLNTDAALLNASGLVGGTGAPTGAVTWTQLTDSGSPPPSPELTTTVDAAPGTALGAPGVGFLAADQRGDAGALDQLFSSPDLLDDLQAV